MQQIVDLQNDAAFQALGVALVSITADSQEELVAGAQEYGVTTPLCMDDDKSITTLYDMIQWATPSGEPSHSFVLVDTDGTVAWMQDYGSPQNRGVMYVPVEELVQEISSRLN